MSIRLKDLYGQKYGIVHEFGLADSFDPDDFTSKMKSLKDKWVHICPGFFPCFERKRKQLFAESVIESAREGTGMAGLFYRNDIESMHFVEKVVSATRKQVLWNSLIAFELLLMDNKQKKSGRCVVRVLTV